jgi:hypothetical protein
MIAGSCCSIGCWLLLLRWYSLLAHASTPAFALDKIPGHFSSPVLQYTTLILLVLNLIYAMMYWIMWKTSTLSAWTRSAVIFMVVGSGIVNILIYPIAAIDVFYYLAELKLTYFYDQNPYIVTFSPAFDADPFARFGWPLHVPLAYGPAWVLFGGMPAALTGYHNLLQLLFAYKVFSFALLVLCASIIYSFHNDVKSGMLGAFAFLGNPLVIFEAVGNGHNDIMMTAFLLAAVLALKRRSWMTLPLLFLSALVKVFTVALLPLFLLMLVTRTWGRAILLPSGLVAAAITCMFVAPFWSDGRMLNGMSQAIEFANNLKTASVFSFVSGYLHQHMPGANLEFVRPLFGLLFLSLSGITLWRVKTFDRVLVHVLLLLYTLVGSIQPWYWIPVIGLLVLRHDVTGIAYLLVSSAIGLLIYPLDVWARFESGLPFAHRHLMGTILLSFPAFVFLVFDWHRSNVPVSVVEDVRCRSG